MKQTLFVVFFVACGGGQSSSGSGTATATATVTATATATATDSAPVDDSPVSIGTRHKKVGNGWFVSGGGKDLYEAIYEPGASPRVVLKPLLGASTQGRWVTLMKNVSAAPYIGKRIRIRVDVKSAGVTGRGELWARTSAPHTPEDAPSTTTKIDPTTEMKTYEVVIDVKDGSRVVEYGVSIAGEGQVWVGADHIDGL
jgi:hypothetical protein